MEHIDGFLSYESKREELKVYITNKINSVMRKRYKLRYIRTTISDGYQLTTDLIESEKDPYLYEIDLYKDDIEPIFLETDMQYTMIDRRYDLEGYSFAEFQMYYDENIRKVYLYYVIDPNNRWGRADLVKDMYSYINYALLHDIYHDQSCAIEILGPSENSNVDGCGVKLSETLSIHTISYTHILDNRKYFIDDPTVTINDKYKAYLNGAKDFSGFRIGINAINAKYNFFQNPEDITTGFAEYNELYRSYFNKELPNMSNTDKIDQFYLLNYSDYSIRDKYIPNIYKYIK